MIVDVGLMAAAPVLALILRDNLVLDLEKLEALIPYIGMVGALAVPVNIHFGLDRSIWRYVDFPDCVRVVFAVLFVILGATICAFLYNRMAGIARSIPILQLLISVVAMIAARATVRLWASGRAYAVPALAPVESNMSARSDLIVGVNGLAMMLLSGFGMPGGRQLNVAGLVSLDENAAGTNLSGRPIFGPKETLQAILRRLSQHGVKVGRILVTVPAGQLPRRLESELRALEEGPGIRVRNIADAFRFLETDERPCDRAAAASSKGTQPLTLESDQIDTILTRPYWRVKRLADAVIAAVLLVALAPLLALLALVVRVFVGSPVYFWQVRTGYRGRPFKLYKFRTMAEAFTQDGQSVEESKRQNAIGTFLRATRLDELPQLWNILIGEMSFVGPRPLLDADLADGAALRYLVRPGLTGWAQVMGGRTVSATNKLALDVWYVKHASFRLDARIVLLTVPMVLLGERLDHAAIRQAWADVDRTEPPAGPLDASTQHSEQIRREPRESRTTQHQVDTAAGPRSPEDRIASGSAA